MSLKNRVVNRLSWQSLKTRVRLRRRVWDALFDRSLARSLADGCLHSQEFPPLLTGYPFAPDQPISLPPIDFASERQYLYHLKREVVIEPVYGYAIALPHSLIDLSLPGSEILRERDWIHYFNGLPSVRQFRRDMSRRPESAVRNDVVVSMRHLWEGNYYHFFQDMMSHFYLLDRAGIDPAIPIVVGRKVFEASFFQAAIRRGRLRERRWIVQDDDYVHAGEVIFARSARGERQAMDYFLDMIEAPRGDPGQGRRIFLTRKSRVGRYVDNAEELTPVLEKFGFESLDPGELSLEEQMRVFSEAGFVAGIHGAGLTNIVFRRGADLNLLEIFPPNDSPPHYYALCRSYDFGYDHLFGANAANPKTRYTAFSVAPERLDAKLTEARRNGLC